MSKKGLLFITIARCLLLPGLLSAASPDGALRMAILNDDAEAVEAAVNKGANINLVREDYTDNPLALAIGQGNASIVRLLLQKGANPNVQVTGNSFITYTPLLQAISAQNQEIVKLLLDMGADVNFPSHKYYKPGEKEFSPLMMAVLAPYTKDSADIFEYILNKGADISYTTSDGYTVLMVAASGDYSRYKKEGVYLMAQTLLKRGAGLYQRNRRGETALDIALIRGFNELAALFNQERFKALRTAPAG